MEVCIFILLMLVLAITVHVVPLAIIDHYQKVVDEIEEKNRVLENDRLCKRLGLNGFKNRTIPENIPIPKAYLMTKKFFELEEKYFLKLLAILFIAMTIVLIGVLLGLFIF